MSVNDSNYLKNLFIDEALKALQVSRGGSSSSGGVSPQLIVTAPEGSTITAVNGEDGVTGMIGAEGTLTLDLPAFGTWAVTATFDGLEASTSIYIEQEYDVSISYNTTFTVNGGHAETITVEDGETVLGTVTLDDAGTGEIVLNGVTGKTLTFTGGLSGYVRTVEIANNAKEMTVNVYPDGALYWYGREFEEKTGGWKAAAMRPTALSGYTLIAPTLTKNTNNMTMKTTGGSTRAGSVIHNNALDFSGYTVLNVIMSATRTTDGALRVILMLRVAEYYSSSEYKSVASLRLLGDENNHGDTSTSLKKDTYSVPFENLGENHYAVIGYQNNGSDNTYIKSAPIYAVWLE